MKQSADGARPPGRGPKVRAAVLAATLAELTENGYAALTIENIGRRCGVHKTTIYRRWRDREGLVADAVSQFAGAKVPVPDTGDIAADLRQLARSLVRFLNSPAGRHVLAATLSDAARIPAIADAKRRFFQDHFRQAEPAVSAAIARRELPATTDPAELIRTLIAPIYLRVLVTAEPIDQATADHAAQVALAAARAGALTAAHKVLGPPDRSGDDARADAPRVVTCRSSFGMVLEVCRTLHGSSPWSRFRQRRGPGGRLAATRQAIRSILPGLKSRTSEWPVPPNLAAGIGWGAEGEPVRDFRDSWTSARSCHLVAPEEPGSGQEASMFHDMPAEVLDRMRELERRDNQDRRDGTPRLERLRQIPPETGRFLALWAASAPDGACIEIGTSAGYSALWLALACRARGRSLTTFEVLPQKAELARQTFARARVGDVVRLVNGDFLEHAGELGPVGFCFLDAEKEIYRACYDAVVPRLVPGGVLIADNAVNHRETLQPMLDVALADDRVDALIVPLGKGELICRKR